MRFTRTAGEAPADAGTAASAAAGAAPIGRIGTADPAGDMKAMVAAGHAQEALQQTAAVLEKIVDEAATPALFRKAAEAAAELRAACVAQGRPAVFNELLKVRAALFFRVQPRGLVAPAFDCCMLLVGMLFVTSWTSQRSSEEGAYNNQMC